MFLFCFVSFFLCFWPPHLTLNPPYSLLGLFCFAFFFGGGLFCFVYFEGLRSGEVARRATSLGPKPSLLFFGEFFFLLSFLFEREKETQKHCFSPKKDIFLLVFLFSVFLSFFFLPCLFLSFFWIFLLCLLYFLDFFL